MLVLYLLSPGFKVMLVPRNPLAFAFACLNSVRPTVETDAIDVIHYHRAVVRVMNHRHVDVGHRAIVDKFSSAPFASPEAHSGVAIAVVNSAVKADVWSPVTGMPEVNAFAKT